MYVRYFKRILDIAIALVAIVILAPLLLAIALAIVGSGEREVVYRQQRIGYRKKYFNIWKFATMHRDSPKMQGGYFTTRNDPRVTRIGRWLRRTKLNELPQFINVLNGTMSLVGPRPLVDETFNAYSDEEQAIISRLKPGITGIGSLVFRDEEKWLSATAVNPKVFYFQHIAPYKAALEIWYAAHCTFSTDLLLLFLTVWTIPFPHSHLHYRIFKDLPTRPAVLES
ncbi:MAG: sugar transferase [Saprospiraceae bacterium]